jgi:hypothetical protein
VFSSDSSAIIYKGKYNKEWGKTIPLTIRFTGLQIEKALFQN